MSRAKVQNRLRNYWKMEAANAFVVPATGAILVVTSDDNIDLPMFIAGLATTSLLVIGTFALRAHFKMSEGDSAPMAKFVPTASKLQKPMALLSALAVFSAGFSLWHDAGFSPSAIATCVFALLAVLEYINYFVVQLQHFDHGPDFRRLMSGKGFRPSHLARAIARHRLERRGLTAP
jgi:hypothetical protein